MTHESAYKYGYLSEDYGSCSKSGKVRISYFDPMTGEPCDSKPKPRSETLKERKLTSCERLAERIRAEEEAAEIMRNMAERRKAERKQAANKKKRPVKVDDAWFESVAAAASEVGTSPEWLCHVLKNGASECKGRRIEFAESEG